MTRRFIFTDEAGDFAFKRGPNIPRYFVVCSVTLDNCGIGTELTNLHRQLCWEDIEQDDFFHATSDQQKVRDRVFQLLSQNYFRVDATILEKSKAQPHITHSKETFYKYAWYYHFKHIGPSIASGAKELHITTASIGTKKGQAAYTSAVNDVVQQVLPPSLRWRTTFRQSMADPCLQIADYCTWAIQRKWERQDLRSYSLISARISTEFDLWKYGQTHHY